MAREETDAGRRTSLGERRSTVRALVLGVVVLAAGGALWWALRSDAPDGPREDARERETPGDVADADASVRALAGRERPAPSDATAAVAPPPGDASLPTPPGETLSLVGRVLATGRRPAVGVEVRARGEGWDVPPGRTDGDGRFRIAVPRPARDTHERVRVVATGPAPQVAAVTTYLFAQAAAEHDAGVLVLREGHATNVQVRSACPGALPATVWVVEGGIQGGGVHARLVTDAAGRVDVLLPRGEYRFLGIAAGCGRGTATASVPREAAEPLVLAIPASRDVALEVVEKEGGAPIPGATVSLTETVLGNGWMWQGRYVPAHDVLPTDAQGRTTVHGLGESETVVVSVAAPGRPAEPADGYRSGRPPTIAPADRSLRVEVPGVVTRRWPLTDKDGPIPADGTVVRVVDRPGAVKTLRPDEARVEGRFLVAERCGAGLIQAMAIAPDGSIAPLYVKPDGSEALETSFRPARRVVVRARTVDGAPATGLWANVRNQGNNPLGEPARVDESGVATIGGLHAGLVQVHLSDTREAWSGWGIGTVDLTSKDGEIDTVVEPTVPVVLRIRIDGVAALPDGLSVACGGRKVVAREDPALGEVRFETRKAGVAMGPGIRQSGSLLQVTATGFQPVQRQIPLDGSGTPVEIDLERAGALSVTVRMPADGRLQASVERWDAVKQEWTAAGGYEPGGAISRDGRGRFASLASGRYRVIDRSTGLASGEVDVVAGGPDAVLELDASRVGNARGRVEAPDGTDLTKVRVRVRGATPSPHRDGPGDGAYVNPRGEFWLRVPGDRPVEIEAVHPVLVAGDDARAVVTTPRDGIVLRLSAGTTARSRWDPPPKPPSWEHNATLRVLLFAGEPTGSPAHEQKAIVEGDVVRFGGFPPGRYTVWIDGSPHAPFVLRDVELGAGETDLGEVRPARGATVRLRLVVKPGEAVPRIGLSARAIGEPTYQRHVASRGQEVVELSGLGPGTFELTAHGQMAPLKPFKETVESDGTSVIEHTFDLR